MQRNLRCLYVKENSLPEEIIIPNTLKAKQDKVEGLIEYTYLPDDDEVVIICNEEGKIYNVADYFETKNKIFYFYFF